MSPLSAHSLTLLREMGRPGSRIDLYVVSAEARSAFCQEQRWLQRRAAKSSEFTLADFERFGREDERFAEEEERVGFCDL